MSARPLDALIAPLFSLSLLAAASSASPAAAQAAAPIDASKVGPAAAALNTLSAAPVTPGASALLGSTWTDDFNRPDAATLGADWLLQQGAFAITSNRGASTAGGVQWVRHASASRSYDTTVQSIDFFAAPVAQVMFVALVAGVGASSDNVFVKVQDNTSDGTFDRVFIYRGINGSPLTSPYFFDLVTPTTQGRMTVSFSAGGDTVDIAIDNDFDGTAEQLISASGILSAGLNLGTSFGVSCFNQPRFDDWRVGDPPAVITNYCTPGTSGSGCVATLAGVGTPSLSQSSGFVVQTNNVEGQRAGLYFYGISGEVAFPWSTVSGFLCVKAPTLRFALQNSGGTAGQCNGQMSVDFLAFLAATPNALGEPFSAGDQVWMQSWFRDPATTKTTMVSDGLNFAMQP